MGGHAIQSPFPGSIRQFIARKTNPDKFRFDGPGIGNDRDYGGNGVHAPNWLTGPPRAAPRRPEKRSPRCTVSPVPEVGVAATRERSYFTGWSERVT